MALLQPPLAGGGLPPAAPAAEHRRSLALLFDDTASHYDRVIGLMSLGSGSWYRRAALKRAGLGAGMKLLDVAAGTGAVARAAVEMVGPSGHVLGIDQSMGMLIQASKALRIPLVQGVAERLPFSDGSFNFLSMGYALRLVSDLKRAFAEYFRVLKPGGTVLILDFARPRSRVGRGVGRLYLDRLLPWIVGLTTGSADAQHLVRCCWKTLEELAPPGTILDAMTDCGFRDVTRATAFALLSEYVARKPAG
jgi:demethylmenaquinone methyltransferase/2-methoxy-6-polyprenyl-1,4-benzoquinol methylase